MLLESGYCRTRASATFRYRTRDDSAHPAGWRGEGGSTCRKGILRCPGQRRDRLGPIRSGRKAPGGGRGENRGAEGNGWNPGEWNRPWDPAAWDGPIRTRYRPHPAGNRCAAWHGRVRHRTKDSVPRGGAGARVGCGCDEWSCRGCCHLRARWRRWNAYTFRFPGGSCPAADEAKGCRFRE